MPERSKITWWGSAGYAILGTLTAIAIVVAAVVIVGFVRAKVTPQTASTPVLQSVQAFHAILDSTVVVVVLLAQVVFAVLLAFPLQAAALLLRRRGVSGMVFAKVAGLTLLSSLLSFAALFPALSAAKLMLEDADAQALFLAAALALLYVFHAIGLASAGGSHEFRVESAMPLYTLVISHRGRTAIAQQRRSNWRGFYQAVIEKFPDLAPAAGTMMRTAPEPVPNLTRTWRADVRIDGEDLIVHIVETRD